MANRNVVALAVLAALIPASSAIGQQSPDNGSYWHLLSEQARISYIIGYFTGFRDGTTNAHGKPGNYENTQFSLKQIKDGVDYCYSDPKNVVLAVGECIAVTMLRAANVPKEEIDSRLKQMRADDAKP